MSGGAGGPEQGSLFSLFEEPEPVTVEPDPAPIGLIVEPDPVIEEPGDGDPASSVVVVSNDFAFDVPLDVPFDPEAVDPASLGVVEPQYSVDPESDEFGPGDADGDTDGDDEVREEMVAVTVDSAETKLLVVPPSVFVPQSDALAPEWRDQPDPAVFARVVAQPRAVVQLLASARQPVHAYLFVGPPGAGEMEAALGFGAALLCPWGGCAVCPSCHRALANLHPDLTVVEREGASISVDQAREIIRLASRAPVERDRKVLVLVDFHLVSVAGPTLLKIIEEPPPSTVFLILADHVPKELVTVASRCVQVPFGPVPFETVVETLVEEGSDVARAERAARAASGRLDRARLLVTDETIGRRLEFWEAMPRRIDGSGAAVASLAAEAVALLDSAAVGPLEARQQAELEALEERLEVTGARGGAGLRKELADRHKRELKRLRDDELRFGLGVLQQCYRDVAVDLAGSAVRGRAASTAVATIGAANEALEFNPNVTLLLQRLLLDLPPL